jgi:hypothetical protein
MKLDIEKKADLIFNNVITLKIIESDVDLTSIFNDEVKLPFGILQKLALEDKLNDTTKDMLLAIFDGLIITNQTFIDLYLSYENGSQNIDTIITSTPIIEVEVEKPIAIVKVVKTKVESDKVELPRRYGKEKIVQDIKDQGGVATSVQRAMLKVNDLKNIYVNLSNRGIKAMIGGDETILSDTDCRTITSAITILERKLDEILKTK